MAMTESVVRESSGIVAFLKTFLRVAPPMRAASANSTRQALQIGKEQDRAEAGMLPKRHGDQCWKRLAGRGEERLISYVDQVEPTVDQTVGLFEQKRPHDCDFDGGDDGQPDDGAHESVGWQPGV